MSLLQLPDEILIIILRFITIEHLLKSVTLTCKKFHYLVEEVYLLWEVFDFSFPLDLTESNIKHIFRHARGFKQFLIPGTTFRCSAPIIDLQFTVGFITSRSLYWLDISDSPVSTLCFLRELPNIEVLNLTKCTNLSDLDFSALGFCLKLDKLYLSFTHILPSTVVELCGILKLTVLDVCGIDMLISDCENVLNSSLSSLLCFHLSLADSEESIVFHERVTKRYLDCSFHILRK